MLLILLLGYLLMAVLYYTEYRYESSRSTTMLQTSGNDQGTTTLLFVCWMMGGLVTLVLSFLGWWPLWGWLAWIGLGWILGGICLLRWTMLTNAFYIRPMATTDDQFLCTDGPYKVIRHPGYVAFYLAWLGLALASGSGLALLLVAVLMGFAYVRRIHAEEQMMLEHFGVDYQHYANESFRVLPFIY